MSSTLEHGAIFAGRYRVLRRIATGGMGVIYEVLHLETERRRALKVMLPGVLGNDELRQRFVREAKVVSHVESDFIVDVVDAGIDAATETPFLVMELLRGEDLLRVLATRGALPAGEVVLLLSQAALALDKTHAAGIVHRDLKPENLYLTTRDDGSPRLKILDFGIAKVVADVNHTVQQTATIGTPLYMPPEQIRGEGTIGPRADVYALGHIAFTLLTGRAYWDDEQRASPSLFTFLGKVVDGLPEPATVRAARRGVALPPAFDAWFARATARAASARPDRASALVADLAVAVGAVVPMGETPMPPAQAASMGAPAADSAAHGSAPRISQPAISQPAMGSGPSGTPAHTGPEGRTEGTSSKSVASPPRRSSLPMTLAVVGVLGSAAAGLLWAARTRLAPAATGPTAVATTAEAQAVTTAAPEPEPAPPPSALPQVVPPDADPARALAPDPSTPAPSAGAASAPAPPSAKAAPGVPGRPPVAAKRPAGGQACDPPYVIDGAGHRHMKPQCL